MKLIYLQGWRKATMADDIEVRHINLAGFTGALAGGLFTIVFAGG